MNIHFLPNYKNIIRLRCFPFPLTVFPSAKDNTFLCYTTNVACIIYLLVHTYTYFGSNYCNLCCNLCNIVPHEYYLCIHTFLSNWSFSTFTNPPRQRICTLQGWCCQHFLKRGLLVFQLAWGILFSNFNKFHPGLLWQLGYDTYVGQQFLGNQGKTTRPDYSRNTHQCTFM